MSLRALREVPWPAYWRQGLFCWLLVSEPPRRQQQRRRRRAQQGLPAGRSGDGSRSWATGSGARTRLPRPLKAQVLRRRTGADGLSESSSPFCEQEG